MADQRQNHFVIPILVVVMILLGIYIYPKVYSGKVSVEKREMSLNDLQIYCQNKKTVAIPKERDMKFDRVVVTPEGEFILFPDDFLARKEIPYEGTILVTKIKVSPMSGAYMQFWKGFYQIGSISDRLRIDYSEERVNVDLIFSLDTKKIKAGKEKDS